jgi:hypothetical protein
MLMRLLGAFCPNTVDGTIAGKPAAATAPKDIFRNALRGESTLVFISAIVRPPIWSSLHWLPFLRWIMCQ